MSKWNIQSLKLAIVQLTHFYLCSFLKLEEEKLEEENVERRGEEVVEMDVKWNQISVLEFRFALDFNSDGNSNSCHFDVKSDEEESKKMDNTFFDRDFFDAWI